MQNEFSEEGSQSGDVWMLCLEATMDSERDIPRCWQVVAVDRATRDGDSVRIVRRDVAQEAHGRGSPVRVLDVVAVTRVGAVLPWEAGERQSIPRTLVSNRRGAQVNRRQTIRDLITSQSVPGGRKRGSQEGGPESQGA